MDYRMKNEVSQDQTIIMPLIGSNLEDIRELQPEGKFTHREICKLAIVVVSFINYKSWTTTDKTAENHVSQYYQKFKFSIILINWV
jgi:hypothetical protein